MRPLEARIAVDVPFAGSKIERPVVKPATTTRPSGRHATSRALDS
jgi:hypothetical protein